MWRCTMPCVPGRACLGRGLDICIGSQAFDLRQWQSYDCIVNTEVEARYSVPFGRPGGVHW